MPYALSHLFDTLCAMRSALCDFPSQQSWLFQFLQCSFICCTVSEALPEVFPDGTNFLHFSFRVKAKCFFTSPLCFRLYKGLLLQVVELLARDSDFTYDFRCCFHNKRPAMRKIWGHLLFPSNPHVSRNACCDRRYLRPSLRAGSRAFLGLSPCDDTLVSTVSRHRFVKHAG